MQISWYKCVNTGQRKSYLRVHVCAHMRGMVDVHLDQPSSAGVFQFRSLSPVPELLDRLKKVSAVTTHFMKIG